MRAKPEHAAPLKALARTELTPIGMTEMVAEWKGLAANTRHTYINTAKSILRKIGKPELAAALPNPPKPAPRQTLATVDQLHTLLRIASPDLRLIILLAAGLALRWSEILGIEAENWTSETRTLRVKVKGGNDRSLAVADEIGQLIDVGFAGGEGTLIQRLAGKKLGHQGIRKRWMKLTKSAGLEHLNPHDLRRTAAVTAYRQTHDIIGVKALLGHTDLATTMWYLKPHEQTAMTELQRHLLGWNRKGERVQ